MLMECGGNRRQDSDNKSVTDFMPKAMTCGNTLCLPRGSMTIQLADDDKLFTTYDYAFANAYFGKM
eukprot:gene10510-11614_t